MSTRHPTTLAPDLNLLRRGSTYQATTAAGTTVGEYLGIEVPYGQRAILLRHADGTDSIAVGALTSITPSPPRTPAGTG